MHDFKFALRQLRKSPGFAFVAVLTLALGIGANVVVFGLVNAALLRPLDVNDPQNLYQLRIGSWTNWKLLTTSYPSRNACVSTSFEYPWHFAVSYLS